MPLGDDTITANQAKLDALWQLLRQVPDPEIPVVNVVEMGMIRDLSWQDDGRLCVTYCLTYSGCPATSLILAMIESILHEGGVAKITLKNQISPAWTTDWLSDETKAKLLGYGIVPPSEAGRGQSAYDRLTQSTTNHHHAQTLICPHCQSSHTEKLSQFGSTPCKASYRCLTCLEPFEHFKCH